MNPLQLFDDKLIQDDRSPIYSFTYKEEEWGLFLPSVTFWLQILTCLFLSSLFFLVMYAITFRFIIPNRDKGSSAASTACLIAFGVVMPISAIFPIFLLDTFDVSNQVVRFCSCAIFPVCTFFRTSEALNGYSPRGVETSFKRYLLYNLCILPIQYAETDDERKDDKTRKHTTNQICEPLKTTTTSVLTSLTQFGKYVVFIGIFMSLFSPSKYEPFDSSVNVNENGIDFTTFFNWNLFKNNCICTLFFQIALTAFTTALGLIAQVTYGIQTESAFHNPIFTATTIAEFWGEKWNLIVHGVLKRGVFKPVYRITSSRVCSILATFLMSGLFHEYLLLITTMHPSHETKPRIGLQTAFMIWNAGTLTIEFCILKLPVVQKLRERTARPILTALVLSSAMPIAHWFIQPLVKCGFLEDFHVGFPMILKL